MAEYQGVPGPWEYRKRNWRGEESKDYYVSGDRRQCEPDECEDEWDAVFMTASVCIVPTNPTSHPVCEHTVRLIIAAPEMYALLRKIAGETDPGQLFAYGWVATEARAILDRLHGGQAVGPGSPPGPT